MACLTGDRNRVEVVRDMRNKFGDSRPARFYVVNSGPFQILLKNS